MLERAYAKINLSLNITGVREDGYHTLDSIFLPLDFFDELLIVKNPTMEFSCNLNYVIYNETNTIYQAIELMKSEFNITDNFKIDLKKHIPTRAGLGGGSSDGAATIRLLNRMYDLNLTDDKVKELCLKIGADVLFTYYSNPARVTGIGEEIREIEVKNDYYILLVKPKLGVSTKECYKKMDDMNYPHPDIENLEKALKEGTDFISYIGNSMEPAAISLLDKVSEAKKLLLDNGAPFALMSGSGSTVFTASCDKGLINRLYELTSHKGYFTRYTKVLKKPKNKQ